MPSIGWVIPEIGSEISEISRWQKLIALQNQCRRIDCYHKLLYPESEHFWDAILWR